MSHVPHQCEFCFYSFFAIPRQLRHHCARQCSWRIVALLPAPLHHLGRVTFCRRDSGTDRTGRSRMFDGLGSSRSEKHCSVLENLMAKSSEVFYHHGYGMVWVNTYRYIFSGMIHIHLPAILGFTRYQGFDP